MSLDQGAGLPLEQPLTQEKQSDHLLARMPGDTSQGVTSQLVHLVTWNTCN